MLNQHCRLILRYWLFIADIKRFRQSSLFVDTFLDALFYFKCCYHLLQIYYLSFNKCKYKIYVSNGISNNEANNKIFNNSIGYCKPFQRYHHQNMAIWFHHRLSISNNPVKRDDHSNCPPHLWSTVSCYLLRKLLSLFKQRCFHFLLATKEGLEASRIVLRFTEQRWNILLCVGGGHYITANKRWTAWSVRRS